MNEKPSLAPELTFVGSRAAQKRIAAGVRRLAIAERT